MTPDRTAAIGIDVGGTKVALGVVTSDGELISRDRVENRTACDAGALLASVAAAARRLADPLRIVGVGVGICELVDLDGEIRSSTSIPWTREELVRALAPIGPVTLEADVRTAALAEARRGAGRPFSSFVYVSVGTGISHCLVVDGEPQAGAHGFAQLVGSTPLTVRCGDSRTTLVLEKIASGPALAGRCGAGSAEEVLARAAAGDAAAVAAVEDAATMLGSFVALLVGVLDPEAVVVGGGLGSAPGAYWETTVRAARAHVWSEHVRSLPIVHAELGADAGLVGAGLAALRQAVGAVR
jgi:glucokinase